MDGVREPGWYGWRPAQVISGLGGMRSLIECKILYTDVLEPARFSFEQGRILVEVDASSHICTGLDTL